MRFCLLALITLSVFVSVKASCMFQTKHISLICLVSKLNKAFAKLYTYIFWDTLCMMQNAQFLPECVQRKLDIAGTATDIRLLLF